VTVTEREQVGVAAMVASFKDSRSRAGGLVGVKVIDINKTDGSKWEGKKPKGDGSVKIVLACQNGPLRDSQGLAWGDVTAPGKERAGRYRRLEKRGGALAEDTNKNWGVVLTKEV